MKLAPYAVKTSRGRKYPEERKNGRSPFERDIGRIIHSEAFRRLEYKTQVFVNHEGDYYRTRLTHTLEVAQIGRSIAKRLSLNEELTEAIALAHDLGHTPFGHSGEKTLNELMKNHGGFEHNLQSLRIVEKLEERYPQFPGLNLTWETKEGLIKHPVEKEKIRFYEIDISEYELSPNPTLEAQVVDIADEIAYSNHDIDDGLESGLINLDQLMEIELWRILYKKVEKKFPNVKLKQKRYYTISSLIGYLISDVVNTTKKNIKFYEIKTLKEVRNCEIRLVSYSSEVRSMCDELKKFLYENLYSHFKVERMKAKAEKYITMLFQAFSENPKLLPHSFQKRIKKTYKERVICDYIAGMTDRYIFEEYKKLFEPYEKM